MPGECPSPHHRDDRMIPLQSGDLVDYLLSKGVLTREQVVDGEVTVLDASRRNRNLKVLVGDGRGFFVKQLKKMERQGLESFRREAAFYWLVAEHPEFGVCTDLAPRCLGYDAHRQVLLLELVPGAETLLECQQGGGQLEHAASELGASLARLHTEAGAGLRTSDEATPFPRSPPWVLSMHELSLTGAEPLSGGMHQLVRTVSQDASIRAVLDALRDAWHEDALIHGDLKWDNVLLEPTEGEKSRVRLVDWELADFGDSGWDVGSTLQMFWSLPVLAGRAAGARATGSWRPARLGQLARPGPRAFWSAYADRRGLEGSGAQDFLVHAIRMAAGRMVLTTYEALLYSSHMTPATTGLLSLARALGERPEPWVDLVAG